MRINAKPALLTVGVLVAIVAAGCSGNDDSRASSARPPTTTAATNAKGTFVGILDRSNAYVGIAVGADGTASAFVTDGAESVDWVEGRLVDDTAFLGNDGGATLEAEFAGHRVSGTFTRPDSAPLTFSAAPADTPAGLYRAVASFADGDYVGGWVVLPDGTQRGSVRRYETPLPPGSVDVRLDPARPTFTVPGGTLTAELMEEPFALR